MPDVAAWSDRATPRVIANGTAKPFVTAEEIRLRTNEWLDGPPMAAGWWIGALMILGLVGWAALIALIF